MEEPRDSAGNGRGRGAERGRLAKGRAMLDHAEERARGAPEWSLAELAGRLVEIAGWRGGATYTAACELVLDAQVRGEHAAWIGPRGRGFLPADVAAMGVDLDALPIVRARSLRDLALAADVLARSSAFALVVVDLGALDLSLGVLARLAGLARSTGTTIALLTEKPPNAPSLGSFVSLRADTRFHRSGEGRYEREVRVSRDRVRAREWERKDERRGPPGLS